MGGGESVASERSIDRSREAWFRSAPPRAVGPSDAREPHRKRVEAWGRNESRGEREARRKIERRERKMERRLGGREREG